MAGISFIEVDLGDTVKSVMPFAFLAAGAFGIYWLWTQVQSNQAQAAAAQEAAQPDELAAQSEQLASLESLLTNDGTSTGGGTSTTQVTYQAPASGPATLSSGPDPGLVLSTGGTTNNGVLTVATGPTTGTTGTAPAPASTQLGASTPGSV